MQPHNETNTPEDLHDFFRAAGSTQAVIGFVGVVFNALNIFVLSQLVKRRRGVSPTYHLLIAMGVADMMALFIITFYRFSLYTRKRPILFYDLSEEHSDFYHIIHYIGFYPANVFSLASNWLVVATTVFRFLAVNFPLKVCRWCTLLRMRLSILVIFSLSLIMNIPDWLTVKLYRRDDGRIRGNDTWLYSNMPGYHLFYAVLESYTPFLINLVLVIGLILSLRATSLSMSRAIQDDNVAAREKEHRKISIMLIAIVLWFLICNLPYIVYQILRDFSVESKATMESKTVIQRFSMWKDFGLILSHTCNIIFYCLCNSTYRKIFVRTLLCKKSHLRSYSTRTGTTQFSKYDSISASKRGESRREEKSLRKGSDSPEACSSEIALKKNGCHRPFTNNKESEERTQLCRINE